MKPRKLQISFDRTPEQLDLVRRMGSKNKTESLAAAEALASVMTQPILQVIEQAPVISNLFQQMSYSAGAASTIALDPYFDVRARNFLNVWTQSQPGGNSQNFNDGATELWVQTIPYVAEVSCNKNQLRAGDLDYLAAYLTRLTQEVLLVRETNAAFVLFNSLAGARIDGNGNNNATNNLTAVRSTTAGVWQLDDWNNLEIGYDRTTASWVGGTPVNDQRDLTDLLGSPEWMGQIRSIAYQPQNTRQGAVTVQGGSSLAAPESLREEIFGRAGIPTLFGMDLHKVYEMGVGRPYNGVYATAVGNTQLPANGVGFGGAAGGAFNSATEQVVVGLNTAMFDLVKLTMSEFNSTFSLVSDDQFSLRQDRIGFVGSETYGYVSVEGRAKFASIF
jgi:hypothetical protein